MALKRLQSEYKQLLKEPNYFFSVEPDIKNFFVWNVLIIGPPDSPYDQGIFKAQFKFPTDYPNRPPEFKFISNLYHPNIYVDGKVCISILHEGHDIYGYEHISERWNPSHSVNSILMSVISMISNPNFESPANVDASVEWKKDFTGFKRKIYKMVAQTQR